MATPASVAKPILSVSVLGTVSVAVADRPIRIKNRKSSAVVAYLALSETLSESRERLVGLLWSESEEDKARGSLRQTLRELRALFGEAGYEGFRTDKLAVEIDRPSIELDLWAVIGDAEAGRAHPLLLERPRPTDTLLDGLDDLDSAFRVWLLAKRETIHNRLLRALETALRDRKVEAGRRADIAAAILNLDPTHEEACRHVMTTRVEAGDVSGALRAYKALWDLLDSDYDMEPSAGTQQLVADIKSGVFEPPISPPRSATSEPDGPVERPEPAVSGEQAGSPRIPFQPAAKIELALEAFDIGSVEPDKVHLVRGFRQHLIASLVRFREWYVTDRSIQSPSDAGQLAVSARYAVHAAAFQTGNVVSLILTLRQIDTNHYIWSDRFELKLSTWFAAQQRVVRRLTMALNVNLSAERLMRLAGQPDVSLDIYDLWLRGQSAFLSFDPAQRRAAAEVFAEVMRAAPNFSPVHSSMAQLINTEHIAFPGLFRSRSNETRTLELARKAVQLDPLDSRAHLAMAWSHAMSKQYDSAAGHAELASQLNDNNSWTVISAAHVLAYCANFPRAKKLTKQAFEMSPLPGRTPWDYLAKNRFLWGDYAGCIAAAHQAGDLLIALPAWTAAAHLHAGNRDEAAREAERFLGLVRARWFGAEEPTSENIMRWFLHQYPISRRQDWERLRDGLAGAGVPVGGMDHHAW